MVEQKRIVLMLADDFDLYKMDQEVVYDSSYQSSELGAQIQEESSIF